LSFEAANHTLGRALRKTLNPPAGKDPAMAPHPPVTGLVVWVYTEDLDGTCAFYSDTLGLKQVRDEGDARMFETGPGHAVGVSRATGFREVQPAGGMITIVTDDVDDWYARLDRAGATLRGKPERNDQFGIYAFLAEDPNGYLIEFQKFLDER
jgi:predicted enzyme related to lactoylglutathione lyase